MKSLQFSKEISQDLSSRIRNLFLFLIVQVVFIHAYHLTWHKNPSGLDKFNYFIQYFISQEICRIAVPLFFIISGYLFFVGYSANVKWFFNKWRRRISSLVIPYLLWSIIGIVAYYVMQHIPSTTQFFTHKLLKDYTLFEFLKTLLWTPFPYQLWFIRYLALYILLTPLIYFICKKGFGILAIVMAISLLVIIPALSQHHLIDSFRFGAVLNFLGYFLLGSFFSINRDKIRLDQKTGSCLSFCFIWITLCLVDTYLKVMHNFTIFGLHDLSVFVGIYFVWILSGKFQRYVNQTQGIAALSLYTFFLYASHEPLLTILKKGGNFLVSEQSPLLLIILYFLCPIMTIMISISVAILLSRHLPKMYMRLTGFR